MEIESSPILYGLAVKAIAHGELSEVELDIE